MMGPPSYVSKIVGYWQYSVLCNEYRGYFPGTLHEYWGQYSSTEQILATLLEYQKNGDYSTRVLDFRYSANHCF